MEADCRSCVVLLFWSLGEPEEEEMNVGVEREKK